MDLREIKDKLEEAQKAVENLKEPFRSIAFKSLLDNIFQSKEKEVVKTKNRKLRGETYDKTL